MSLTQKNQQPSACASIQEQLRSLSEPEYKVFQCGLMPTVDPNRVLGVRTPALRKLAKSLKGSSQATEFLASLPHDYYEENNLHGLLISELSQYEETVEALEAFLPWVDNWATCDLLSPKAFKKLPPELPAQVRHWLESSHAYTVRFALGILLKFYLDEAFQPQYLDWACELHSSEYYINMMIAWYFATALAKQYETTLPYLENRRLSKWVHNKTIQKAVESFRITPEKKTFLRSLCWKDEK